jgi:alpha-tubulin suppressor-like RCC1 family protein
MRCSTWKQTIHKPLAILLGFFLLLALAVSPVPVSAAEQGNTLWGWGYNKYGQLGDGTTVNRDESTRVYYAEGWRMVSAGAFHTAAIKTDGSLWAWGWNEYGQLGDGTNTGKNVPTPIGIDQDWKVVAAGGHHTVAIKNDGSLWAWGENYNGQLGDATWTNRSVPVRVGKANDWKEVTAGGYHTLAIKNDGSLWAWGYNKYGSVGDGTFAGGTINDRNRPVQIGSANDWKTVIAGGEHTLALKTDGSLWAWGWNRESQLGDGTKTSRSIPTRIGTSNDWKEVSAGGRHSVALKTNGTLWAWGFNEFYQLGDGSMKMKSVPTRIGTANDWKSVSAGGWHTMALKTDKSLWVWGYWAIEQVKDFSSIKKEPTRIGADRDWKAVSAGGNNTYELMLASDGFANTSDDHHSKVMSGGGDHSMALGDVPTLTLTKPNAGENLLIGLPYTITWEGFPDTEFTLFLSTDSGKSYGSEIGKGKGGRFEWTVPNMPTNNARIKIWGISSINWMGMPTFVEDVSDADFSMAAYTLQMKILGPPAAPSHLAAEALSRTEIRLTWRDNAEDEQGFHLERNGTQIATLPANTQTYTDTGLIPDTPYGYRVRAYNTLGNSDYSNQASVTTDPEPPPTPPDLTPGQPEPTPEEPGLTPVTPYPPGAAPGTTTVIQLYIDSVEYYVNGQLQTMDTPPVIHEGRTLLPIRYVAEPLGAAVGWEAGQRKATVSLGQQLVELWIGQHQARVNGTNQAIDDMNPGVVPLIMPPGRTMLPLRFIAETLGCQVEWDAATRRVTITYVVP